MVGSGHDETFFHSVSSLDSAGQDQIWIYVQTFKNLFYCKQKKSTSSYWPVWLLVALMAKREGEGHQS